MANVNAKPTHVRKLDKIKADIAKKNAQKRDEKARIDRFGYKNAKFMDNNDGIISEKNKDAYFNQLLERMNSCKCEYVDYVSQNANWHNSTAEMSDMNKFLNYQLLSKCVEPLAHGMTIENVIQAWTMYQVASMVAPEFKNHVHKTVGSALYGLVSDSKWSETKRGQKIEEALGEMSNDGRVPYTAESAVLQKVAFDKKLYEDMRSPDLSEEMKENLSREYATAVDRLKDLAVEDGISPQEFDAQEKTTIGMLVTHDPSFARMYNEFAMRDVQLEEPYEDMITVDDANSPNGKTLKSVKVLSGDLVDADGEVYKGSFTPRFVVGENYYEGELGRVFNDSIWDKCETFEDVVELSNNMPADDKSKYTSDLYLLHDMMHDDGYPKDVQAKIFHNTFVDCGNAWCDAHPNERDKFDAFVKEQYGEPNIPPHSTKGRGHEFDDRFGKEWTETEYYQPGASESDNEQSNDVQME